MAVVAILSMNEVAAQRAYLLDRFQPAQSTQMDTVAIERDTTSLRYRYVEVIKAQHIYNDTVRTQRLADEMLAEAPNYAPILYLKAQNPHHRGKPVMLKNAKAAYEQDTTNRWYMKSYAEALTLSGDYAEATKIYRKVIQAEPNNVENYYILSVIYRQTEEWDKALELLNKAELRFGRIEQLTDLKLYILFATKQMTGAEQEARLSYEERPDDMSRLSRLVEIYAYNNKDSLIEQTYIEAIKRDSTNIDVQLLLGRYYVEKSELKKYLSLLNTLILKSEEWDFETKYEVLNRLVTDRDMYNAYIFDIALMINTLYAQYSTEPRAVEMLANHYIYMSDIPRAAELYKKHRDDNPPNEEYYIAIIDIYNYLKESDSVRYYTAEAMQRFPKSSALHLYHGSQRLQEEDLMGCIESFCEAEKYAENDTMRGQILGYIGDIYQQVAQRREELDKAGIKRDYATYPIKMSYKKAMQKCYLYYDLALEHHYDNASVLNNYAYFLSLENRELDRAEQMSKRAIELERNASNLDTYAWILHLRGDDKQAQQYMRQALSRDSDKSPDLQQHYGDILYALGEYTMAKSYWQRALEYGADAEEIEQRLRMLDEKQQK